MLRFQSRTPEPAIFKPRLARKLTESVFWMLIKDAREGAGTPTEFGARLVDTLGAFEGESIRRFDELLRKKLSELRSWDLWAFAHVARGGCSDDSFDTSGLGSSPVVAQRLKLQFVGPRHSSTIAMTLGTFSARSCLALCRSLTSPRPGVTTSRQLRRMDRCEEYLSSKRI